MSTVTSSRLSGGDNREEGSTLPLIAFFCFLGAALTLLLAAATSLYLERERLYTVADGAALAGAESFELTASAPSGTRSVPHPPLREPAVAAAVRDYLDGAPGERLNGLRVEAAGTADGRSATVRLSAQWQPPLLTALVPSGIRIEATSTARSVFW